MRRRCRVVLAVAGHKAQNEAHDEHHGIQTVSGVQRRQRAAVGNDRARHHEGEHGADGAAGQHEVNQLRRGHFGLQGAQGDDRGVNRAGEEAQGQNEPRHMLR